MDHDSDWEKQVRLDMSGNGDIINAINAGYGSCSSAR